MKSYLIAAALAVAVIGLSMIAPPSKAKACDELQQLNAECYSQNLMADYGVQAQAIGHSRQFSRQRVIIQPQRQLYVAPQRQVIVQEYVQPQAVYVQPQPIIQQYAAPLGYSSGLGFSSGLSFGRSQAIIINRDRGRRGPPRDRGRSVQRQRSVQRNR